MRTKKPSLKAFKKAFDGGQIIRLHLMRGTWQLVSAEDYWPLLDLCAPKAIAVTKGWMSSNKIKRKKSALLISDFFSNSFIFLRFGLQNYKKCTFFSKISLAI